MVGHGRSVAELWSMDNLLEWIISDLLEQIIFCTLLEWNLIHMIYKDSNPCKKLSYLNELCESGLVKVSAICCFVQM